MAIVDVKVECPEKEEVDNLVDETIRIDQYINLYHQYVDTNLKLTENMTSISNTSDSKTSNYHTLPGSSLFISPVSDIQTSHTGLPLHQLLSCSTKERSI